MAWFIGQSVVFLVLAFLLGLLVGWIVWGRRRSRRRSNTFQSFQPVAAAESTVEAPPELAPEPATAPPVLDSQPAEPAELAGPAEPARPAELADAAEVAQPVELAAPAEVAEPAELPEPVELAEPAETAELAEVAEPAQLTDLTAMEPATGSLFDVSGAGVPRDNLRRIEGIGPKISTVLDEAGIRTFRQLSQIDRVTLTEILAEGGVKFAPSLATWGEQAQLLADGDDAGHAELARRLTSGRRDR